MPKAWVSKEVLGVPCHVKTRSGKSNELSLAVNGSEAIECVWVFDAHFERPAGNQYWSERRAVPQLNQLHDPIPHIW